MNSVSVVISWCKTALSHEFLKPGKSLKSFE